ncbi:hypothetical protein IRZ71_07905 [Flavobacterium sp. ANB]|uniref:hypothetical protein n=1 Tax=unclassified Flavobacterium TaxID=196869 RepID=UPI0012B77B64|nr:MULTISPECIES: hypothetical protein [unclassified Flavobacterium]MBF4516261.1 hypothetical protein [Flavobacterium sp. ANB]MTD69842.1 hypothetical protein [Flavobacterium sp. LC2016-13]
MILQFKLKEILEVEMYYGFYEIFVLGGFDVKTNPDFFVEILDLKTNEAILLTEKQLKARDYKSGKKAVKFFSFQITNSSKYRVSVHNFEDMVVYNSMPAISSFLLDLFKIREQTPIELEEVEILIA